MYRTLDVRQLQLCLTPIFVPARAPIQIDWNAINTGVSIVAGIVTIGGAFKLQR